MNQLHFLRLFPRLLTAPLCIATVSIAMLASVHASTDVDAVGESADVHMEAGASYFRSGRFEAALQDWTEALRLHEAAKNLAGQSRALFYKGAAFLALGKYPQAIESLQRALTLAEQADDRTLGTAVMGSLGNAYLLSGRVEEAKQLLEASIDSASELGSPDIAAAALNNLGNLLASQKAFNEARAVYRRSLEATKASGNQELAVRTLINLARALLQSGKHKESRRTLAMAMARAEALPLSHDKAYALISAGRLYTRLRLDGGRGDSQRLAYNAFNKALGTAQAIGDSRARAYVLGYLGELYERAKRHDESLRLTRQAIFFAQEANAPEILYRWQWQAGRLLKAQGDIDNAILVYQRAIASLQAVRQELSSGFMGTRVSFREAVGPVFFELADLLLQQSASIADSYQAEKYLKETRETVELLKGAELEDYFQDDCVTALKSRTTGIDQLAAHTAALYPVILKDRLELLLSLPQGMKQFTTPVTAATLTQEVRAFRTKLEKRTTREYLPHAQRLYDWLIRALEPELERQGVDTLVIIPDGALRTVPMAALHDGQDFLILKYAVAITPGLTLTEPRPIKRENIELLLNGLTEPVQGFPPLPNVAEELTSIGELYRGKVLKDQDFITSNVEAELTENPYSIVHIASHGQFDRDVRKTFLLTYEDRLSMDALQQFMGLTEFRKNPVELLTLSACQTAAGDDRAALGLAGVAVKAGARSALATLWFINDRASSLLVSEFYRQLQDPSMSKAKALQQAQLTLLSDRRYRHPGYWSPFLLIGNWL